MAFVAGLWCHVCVLVRERKVACEGGHKEAPRCRQEDTGQMAEGRGVGQNHRSDRRGSHTRHTGKLQSSVGVRPPVVDLCPPSIAGKRRASEADGLCHVLARVCDRD